MQIEGNAQAQQVESFEPLEKLEFNSEHLHRILQDESLPGVIFAMRYPDDAGYVWNTIGQGRDKASSHLIRQANCYIAYPTLTNNPTFSPVHSHAVELDCYDTSAEGLRAIKRFIEKNRVRIIVFMSALPSSINLSFFKRLGVRTINTENDSFDHNKRDSIVKKSFKFFVRRVMKRQLHDLHLANAHSQKSFLLNYSCIPPTRLALLTDGIDCKKYTYGDRAKACAELGLAPEAFWIICVAQARPEKRLDYIIRAAKRVIDARPNIQIRFIYVGGSEGPLIAELKSLVKTFNLSEKFIFTGPQTHLVPYYQAANLMIHAAERESFGLAIVEGMACGLPVVASAAAGPKETVLHEKTGALVGIDDFDGFVTRILSYVDDPLTASQHGENAAKRAANMYSLDRYGKELAKYITEFL